MNKIFEYYKQIEKYERTLPSFHSETEYPANLVNDNRQYKTNY